MKASERFSRRSKAMVECLSGVIGTKALDSVTLRLLTTNDPSIRSGFSLEMTSAEARDLGARLIKMADMMGDGQ
jgi:hypothetical protein